jgi:hypothetical protein
MIPTYGILVMIYASCGAPTLNMGADAHGVGMVPTLAGVGTPSAADGTGTAAGFYYPIGVATFKNGNMVVADTNSYRIRYMTAARVVTTLAGGGPLDLQMGLEPPHSFIFPPFSPLCRMGMQWWRTRTTMSSGTLLPLEW